VKHIISFSGGKDSALMTILLLEREKIDDIVFIDTGVEFPETYKYIERFEKYIGRKITRIKSDRYTWDSLFFHKKTKGERIGQINSFPRIKGCNVNTYLKKDPIQKYCKTIKDDFIVYMGIAANEPKRYARLKPNQRAPLYEWGITETDVLEELKKRDLHNPHYDIFTRQGCFMCPQIGIGGARKLYNHYPKLWKTLLWYGDQAELYAKDRRLAEWIPGWTVRELQQRFEKENKKNSHLQSSSN